MDIEKIIEKNPWWQDKDAINRDNKITIVDSSPAKSYPKLEIKKGMVYVLRGPRQVGKTTFIKLKIRELIQKGVEPKSIMFYSCDQFRKFERISDTIESYVRWCEPQGITPRAIFLDEVTSVAEWARAIKYVKNNNIIRDASIILTGSNSVDLKRGAEKLPGRGIEGNEYFYYPTSFRLFCKLMGKSLPPAININELLSKENDKKFISKLYNLAMDKELKQLFYTYLQTGGFLLAINNYKKNIQTTYETYARWIEGDLSYFKKDVRFAKQVLAIINSKNASQMSINSIARKTEISSAITAKEYISMFEDMQILLPSYKYDISKKQLDYRKEKKYYFLDPLLYHLVSFWTETKPAKEEAIVEGTVASHMYRWAYINKMGFGFYNDGKYEVDVMLKDKDKFIPIEVKWSEKLDSQDWRGLYKFGKGILLNKNEVGFEKSGYLKIPIHAFLILLDIPDLIRIRYGTSDRSK